ncbi:MAG: hypothetical protein ACLQM8_01370 [Limisphaerales bacterium]
MRRRPTHPPQLLIHNALGLGERTLPHFRVLMPWPCRLSDLRQQLLAELLAAQAPPNFVRVDLRLLLVLTPAVASHPVRQEATDGAHGVTRPAVES